MTDAPRKGSTLIIRVWFEGDPPSQLRGRIIEVSEAQPHDRVVAVAARAQDLYEAVRSWLEELTLR